MDALILPLLGVLNVVLSIVIWVVWIRHKDKRALTIPDEDEENP